jgi:hypothetical protein
MAAGAVTCGSIAAVAALPDMRAIDDPEYRLANPHGSPRPFHRMKLYIPRFMSCNA